MMARSEFRDRILEANRAIIALDALEVGHDSLTVSRAVGNGVRTYRELEVIRSTLNATEAESALLQTAMSLLRGRLRRSGRNV